jgi:hypothetical protein
MKAYREVGKLETRGNKMINKGENSKSTQDEQINKASSGLFEIHVSGHLDESWSDWLEGLEVKLLDNGEMILYGHIGDQAALMGVLNKLYRLNLTLLSVNEIKKKQ